VPSDDAMTETKPKKKRFKYTRELVRIALDNGMTQTEIATLCRVQQSQVSAWSRGESKAFEHQVAELKKRYGNRLNRTTSRVYLAVTKPAPEVRWEDTERAQRLLALRGRESSSNEEERKELQEAILPGESGHIWLDELIRVDQEEFEASRREERLTQVEGPVVLRYTFVELKPDMGHGKSLELTRVPVARWLVHRHAEGKFVLVRQARRTLLGRARW
jgi:transcriptional regulator with XRE-family HTH domain